MTPQQERDALKLVIDLSANKDRMVKNLIHWSIVYLLFFLAIVCLLAIVSIRYLGSPFAGLSFAAGVFATLAYSRYVGSKGINFLSEYIDTVKARCKYDALVREEGESKAALKNPYKFLLSSLIIIGVVYFIMYLLDNHANV